MKARFFVTLSLVLAVALLIGGLPALAGPATAVEVNVNESHAGKQVTLDKNNVLVLNLEANPSTGYSWTAGKNALLRQVGESEFKAVDRVGAPTTQVIRFQAIAKGQTTLELVYSRPWEGIETKSFSIQVQAKAPLGVAYKPAPVDTTVVPEGVSTNASVNVLPSYFNWCDQGYCLPIRNQAACGSCWAFSTVGSFEPAIKIATGLEKDLSEQYLVSCNSEGWGCNGGWYAHDYHQWKYITGEPGPGSVYEADFPYTATDEPCNPPHTHHEQISSWAVVGSSTSVAPVDSIKNAIYTYGPVSVAVHVGTDFQLYTGGIFYIRKGGGVNHAVVLTGWNDADGGYWYLRNSWGTNWGEAGYMRIRYGTSQVGYNTTYVVYP
jgi:C1A family cysteine protease